MVALEVELGESNDERSRLDDVAARSNVDVKKTQADHQSRNVRQGKVEQEVGSATASMGEASKQ